jgi:hypothetical protein
MTLHLKPVSRAVLAASVLILMLAGLAGCATSTAPTPTGTGGSAGTAPLSGATSSPTSTTPVSPATVTGGFGSGVDTAQGHYDSAEKAMKATVPDAVFVTVQTPGVVASTPNPEWLYLFGSKKTNKGYVVTIAKGKSDKPLALATEPLKADEWARVPSTSDWKIDSDMALEKASAAYKQRLGTDAPAKYAMGMAVFVSDTAANRASGVKPFVWTVIFDPEAGGADAAAREILVDAKTGAVLPAAK